MLFRSYYLNYDGKYVHDDWKLINNKYYFFEHSGRMAKDQWINGEYYVGSDGAMLSNAVVPGGYYVGADGKYVR